MELKLLVGNFQKFQCTSRGCPFFPGVSGNTISCKKALEIQTRIFHELKSAPDFPKRGSMCMSDYILQWFVTTLKEPKSHAYKYLLT